MSEANKVLVACYGSLRTGQANVHVNARGGGVSIGEGFTKENYNLYRYNGAYFPSVSLAHNDHGTPVRVEVFETTEAGLKGAYDTLEGYSEDESYRFYNRTQIPVILDSGEEVVAWIYHIDQDLPDWAVKHGDWVKHLSEEE